MQILHIRSNSNRATLNNTDSLTKVKHHAHAFIGILRISLILLRLLISIKCLRLAPYSFDGEARVEFKDMTDKIKAEYEEYEKRNANFNSITSDIFDEFLEKNYYETAEIDGKTIYGYCRLAQPEYLV